MGKKAPLLTEILYLKLIKHLIVFICKKLI